MTRNTPRSPLCLPARRRFLGLALAGLAAGTAGCTPEISHRGYRVKPGAFAEIREGLSKSEVEGILGSPSTTASVNLQGDSYYYITSTTVARSFLKPQEVNRQVIAVRFEKNDQVESFAQYGLEDGRIININTRKTPVPGTEFSILQELFRAGTRVGPGGGMLQRKL
jgi:outer membrane protein assembly factor BamE (lipoprotein component of BamABCDE complex)